MIWKHLGCIISINNTDKGKEKEYIKTSNLKKYYGNGENLVKAIDNANIDIKEGEFVAIVGKSGSGKSTLLHMMGGLDNPTEGKVYINDKDIFSLKEEKLAIFRRRNIGFIFQNSIYTIT